MNVRILTTLALALLLVSASSASAAFNVTQIMVAKNTGYGFSDVIQTPDRVYPGDQVSLRFSVYTTRAEGARNVVVTPNTPFLTTTTVFSLGNIVRDVAQAELLSFTVPGDTKPGTYPIYFYATDAATPQQLIGQYQITVNEPLVANRLLAEAKLDEPAKAGDSGSLQIVITNKDPLDATDVIVQIKPDADRVFTPLATDRKYVERIAAGATVRVPFDVGVSAGATPGYYQLPVSIQYAVDQVVQPVINQSLGIQVQARPELLLTVDSTTASGTSASSLTLTVANVGDTPVRGVYIKTSSRSFRIVGASDKFIGTLNLDDSTTMAINLQPRGQVSNESTLDVTVTYKDPNNQEHTLTRSIPVSANELAAGGNGNAALGTRFRQSSRGFLGIDLLGWAVIVFALGVAGFFGYRWHQKRKAQTVASKVAHIGGKK
ncbi:hypothetical protein HYV43_03130 [Candidatus Micrarchaeota archaeon]|nr:hypothetical protein [Candidatus Micrarchaeota archaeon]